MAELAYQTWQNVTGKPWSEAKAGGYTTGSAADNLALQAKLQGGWNPYAQSAPAAAAAPAAAPAPVDYAAQYRQTAEQRLRPSLDLALQALQGEEQGIAAQEAQIPGYYDALAQQLEKEAKNTTSNFEQQQNQRGLFTSGITLEGLAGIQDTLFKNKAQTAQEKANKLAELALARAGIGTRKTQAQQQYAQSIDDMVNQLLNQQREQDLANKNYELQLKQYELQKYALEHPQTTGGSGSSAAAIAQQQADQYNSILNNIRTTAQKQFSALAPALQGKSIIGNKNPFSGYTEKQLAPSLANKYLGQLQQLDPNWNYDTLLSYIYDVRRPYEAQGIQF